MVDLPRREEAGDPFFVSPVGDRSSAEGGSRVDHALVRAGWIGDTPPTLLFRGSGLTRPPSNQVGGNPRGGRDKVCQRLETALSRLNA
ncbi:hypothetical protein GCM10027440_05280 [Nocardiopsis coralliicola]